METNKIIEKQRQYFNSGATLPIAFRINMLKKMYSEIKKMEGEILTALKTDLGKSNNEAFMCEIGLVLSEISYMIKHVRRLAAKRRIATPLAQFVSSSYQLPNPYGNVLIISPWNYPFLLTIDPLVDAIAAGNTAIIKPSEFSPATSKVIAKLIGNCFSEEYVAAINGGIEECTFLLEQKFDFVFFTGSQKVGKIVLKHTAEHLTPAVLELGGKSPCIVDDTAKINLAAKRIIFGKLINCGQTCVAPDYILCDAKIKDKLITELKEQIVAQYGESPFENPDYGKIINEKHFNRISGLIDNQKVVFGGKINKKSMQIEPTILDNVTFEDAVMQEEIFGPIIPIITYQNFDEIYKILNDRAKPLALYIFSENKERIKSVTKRCRYGGGCINDTMIHIATSEMGFGGVGESGMGAYHGKIGFDTFSHLKSIVDKKTWLDLPMRYQPYNCKLYEKLIRLFLR